MTSSRTYLRFMWNDMNHEALSISGAQKGHLFNPTILSVIPASHVFKNRTPFTAAWHGDKSVRRFSSLLLAPDFGCHLIWSSSVHWKQGNRCRSSSRMSGQSCRTRKDQRSGRWHKRLRQEVRYASQLKNRKPCKAVVGLSRAFCEGLGA